MAQGCGRVALPHLSSERDLYDNIHSEIDMGINRIIGLKVWFADNDKPTYEYRVHFSRTCSGREKNTDSDSQL